MQFSPRCVVCLEPATIEKVRCKRCNMEMTGEFRLPRVALLSIEAAKLAELFILCDGSLKEVGKRLGLSYPSVRIRVDQMIKELASLSSSRSRPF